MTAWSRRSVLTALGLSPLLPACGGGGAGNRRATTAVASLGSTRSVLRELVGSMSARFPYAAGLAAISTRRRTMADATEIHREATTRAEVVFTAVDAQGLRLVRRTSDLSPDGLARAAADLVGTATRGDFGKPRTHAAKLDGDPRRPGPWTQHAEQLLDRSRRHGGSRIVYRTTFLDVDDREVVFVGDGRDLLQRVVRARGGVAFVGTAGSTTYTSVAEQASTAGLNTLAIEDDELEAAADSALALLTARRPPSGEFDLVLDPTAAGHFVGRCVAPALLFDQWAIGASRAAALREQSVGSEAVTIIDDPSLPGGFGSYSFDDEGLDAAPRTLIDRGVLRDTLARGRSPSNVYLSGGQAAGRDELMSDVTNGLLLEGALTAYTDAAHWSVGLRASRAREIANGKLTGRLYGPLLLHGDVPGLLGAVRAATSDVRFTAGDDMAMGAPHLLTRGTVVG